MSAMLVCLQYLGGKTPESVQTKVKQLLYSWKLGLPHEPKIQEAYEMLKKEGTINTKHLFTARDELTAKVDKPFCVH